MTARFTDATIRNLKPKEARYDVREGQGDGFMVRVTPNGAKTFAFVYHFNGQKRRHTLGQYPAMPLKDARAALTEARRLVQSGIDPAASKTDKRQAAIRQRQEAARLCSVDALAGAYIEHHAKPNKRTWDQDRLILNRDVLPFWGKLKAEDITPRDVNRILDRIKERGSPIQANRTLALMRKLFNFGIQRGEITANPCAAVARPAPEKVRDRVLSDDELKALWPALAGDGFKCSEHLRLALRLQLLAACRIGEILGARWEEIDQAGEWWEIPAERMKNKRIHRVWIGTGPARAILARLQEIGGGSPWLFPSPKGERPMGATASGHAIRRSLEGLGMAAFSSHDLRRTVATRMGEMGIHPHIIGKVLSHTDSSVTATHYNKWSYDQDKQKALERWASRLLEITEGIAPRAVIPFPSRTKSEPTGA